MRKKKLNWKLNSGSLKLGKREAMQEATIKEMPGRNRITEKDLVDIEKVHARVE